MWSPAVQPARKRVRGGGCLLVRSAGAWSAGKFLGLLNAISCILDTLYDNLKATDLVYFMSLMKILRGYAPGFSSIWEELQNCSRRKVRGGIRTLSHFNVQTFKAFIELTRKQYFDTSLTISNLYLLIIP